MNKNSKQYKRLMVALAKARKARARDRRAAKVAPGSTNGHGAAPESVEVAIVGLVAALKRQVRKELLASLAE